MGGFICALAVGCWLLRPGLLDQCSTAELQRTGLSVRECGTQTGALHEEWIPTGRWGVYRCPYNRQPCPVSNCITLPTN